MRRYSSTDKDSLLAQLHATADALLDYLMTLPAGDWVCDTGLREPDGGPLLVRNDVIALAEDYAGHAKEIAAWTQR